MTLRTDGLTADEGLVMDALVTATNAYGELPVEHPSEPDEFVAAIHRAQDLLAVRIARREYPDGWARFEPGGVVFAASDVLIGPDEVVVPFVEGHPV